MFQPVPASAPFPKLEQEILAFWREKQVYAGSLARRQGSPRFVFFEGPPTANGMPHPGHCLTRAIKDLFPRYRTMRGYLCERKAGWDTHGLPVEVEVCKELGIHSKEEIEAFGVEPFIHKCQASVWRYMQEWERLTERLGFWVDLEEAYVTYHQSFVESVWWSLKNLFDRNLLYQGHKIVWWWAQGGTALSAGEVGQGYREVADPSVYVKFPLVATDEAKALGLGENSSLLIWTTTPWTLPANQFAAVHPELNYAVIPDPDDASRILIVAEGLAQAILDKKKVVEPLKDIAINYHKGRSLVGLRYKPPFNYYWNAGPIDSIIFPGSADTQSYYMKMNDEVRTSSSCPWMFTFKVVPAEFVTIESGTGIVHIAPAFGEVDYEVLSKQQAASQNTLTRTAHPELICPVQPDGKYSSEAPEYEGRWVKDCDREIARDLDARGLLLHREQYLHDYPFCWRADNDPLIQYPRRSWFIKTTAFKDELLANNSQINWLPEHIKDGRFGNFLESNVDWALSRERYWGTPLPIWVCEQTGKMEAIASYDELLTKPGVQGTEVWDAAKQAKPELPDDLRVHKPYIDAVTYASPFAAGARMQRVSEVIDCWYDSGAMPFAQWGYPHQNQEKFREQFPADFISEAIDQTRGWFYSQLAISTLLFGQGEGTEPAAYPHPFRNSIVLGLMLGEDGQKMSKSKRNYREPGEIFDRYGADALRWYFFANQAPWTSIRYKEQAIKDSIPEFLLRLWNCYSFFVIYANIDGFDPAAGGAQASADLQLSPADFAGRPGYRPPGERAEIDRWILSELHKTLSVVVERMDAYDNFEACARITNFVDALSNWYVRRSRDRFWSEDKHSPDKLDAYWTLYECLLTSAKLIAPFTPFLAETLWQNLSGAAQGQAVASVHWCDYPLADQTVIDETLSARMAQLREIASLGLSARMANKLKVRQPLASVEVILSDLAHQDWLREHDELLRDELNVKQIHYSREADKYITYQVQPNFKRLGPRLGKLLPACKQTLAHADGGKRLAELTASGKVTLTLQGETVDFDGEDLQVRLQAKPGWAAAQGKSCVVVLATELTPALVREGLARDFVRLIQDRRKELDLAYTDRIEVCVETGSSDIRLALEENAAYIQGETLAVKLAFEPAPSGAKTEHDLGDAKIVLGVNKA